MKKQKTETFSFIVRAFHSLRFRWRIHKSFAPRHSVFLSCLIRSGVRSEEKNPIKIPNKWLERIIESLPCGKSSNMSVTCDNNNLEMDAYSIQLERRDSSHCFYQNRGDLRRLIVYQILTKWVQWPCLNLYKKYIFILLFIVTQPVIQPLLTGKHSWYSNPKPLTDSAYAHVICVIRDDNDYQTLFLHKTSRRSALSPWVYVLFGSKDHTSTRCQLKLLFSFDVFHFSTTQIFIKSRWLMPTGSRARRTIRLSSISSSARILFTVNSPSSLASKSAWSLWKLFTIRAVTSTTWRRCCPMILKMNSSTFWASWRRKMWHCMPLPKARLHFHAYHWSKLKVRLSSCSCWRRRYSHLWIMRGRSGWSSECCSADNRWNSCSLWQLDGDKCSSLSHRVRPKCEAPWVWLEKSTRTRWWPFCLEICLHWWVHRCALLRY